VLSDYTRDPGKAFWEKFPSNDLPSKISSSINVDNLRFQLILNKNLLTHCQYLRGQHCISNLSNGANSYQKFSLPSCKVPNNLSCKKFGREVTDAVAHWVKKGYASGPFSEPPLKRFRANAILAIDQGEKVRTVLDLSSPKNFSFNSTVDEQKLEKVHMSSAKQFAKTLVIAGKNAQISKIDMVDAYKNIPSKLCDLNLQGFFWLDKYFVETRQIFGAKTAVPNFDTLGNTILSLALCNSEIPKNFVHRTLDDVPIVSPANTCWGQEFVNVYLELCKKLNIDVTVSCPKFEKAFLHSLHGKVLGIIFDSSSSSWRLPDKKIEKTVKQISKILSSEFLDLNDFQSMMGRINFAGQLSPFMQGFKYNLNKILGQLQNGLCVKLTDAARNDLYVWLNFLIDSDVWHPLAEPHFWPPLAYDCFVSDAAGCNEHSHSEYTLGCGNIGVNCENEIIYVSQLLWPKGILQSKRDHEGKLYGQKTTTLEFLGILLPFVQIPNYVSGKYIVIKVDNTSCYYGWLNKQSAGDGTASVLIRTLHLLSENLCCDIHIEHLPRVSTWEAELADRLSRQVTTTPEDKVLVTKHGVDFVPQSLLNWMSNPTEDWHLPEKILYEVLSRNK
jgi:hypothetical protein